MIHSSLYKWSELLDFLTLLNYLTFHYFIIWDPWKFQLNIPNNYNGIYTIFTLHVGRTSGKLLNILNIYNALTFGIPTCLTSKASFKVQIVYIIIIDPNHQKYIWKLLSNGIN